MLNVEMDEWVIEAETEYCVKEDLIRCKDCKLSLMCNRHEIETWWNDYCSWGKREEHETD